MEWQAVVLLTSFALVGLVCIVSIPFGVPGMWMLLGLAVVVELVDTWIVPSPDVVTFGGRTLALCGVLGLFGEAIEAGAGAAGSRFGGGTRRGMWGAIIGGIVGAIAFTVVLPMPLVGTLVGALVGTFVGAFVAESTSPLAPRSRRENLRAALAATVGRLAGTLGKTVIATVIWIVLLWRGFGL